MFTSRWSPQQIEQMSPPIPGQCRRARRVLHILHSSGMNTQHNEAGQARIIEIMKRVVLYIKVEVELDETESPDRVAREICRTVEKIYVVRSAELSSAVPKE
jgi:hypothetical protein